MNTIEQDLEMADFWAQGVNHLETDGWRAVAKRLADEVRHLQSCQEVKHVEPVNVELLAALRLARDMFIANGVDLPRTMTCIRKAITAAESALKLEASPPPKIHNPLLDQPIFTLGLPVRIENALQYHRIQTVGQLTALTWTEVSRIQNIGRKSMTELRDVLNVHGLMLSGYQPSYMAKPDGGA